MSAESDADGPGGLVLPVAGATDGRVPPGQRVTEKFPVMTAGTPDVTPAARWTFELAVEHVDATRGESWEERLGLWDYAAFRALGVERVVCDIHCVTRWSKLDVAWRGVSVDALLAAAGHAPGEGVAYARAECDGGYAANLKLADRSMSTKSTPAPQYSPTFEEATKLFGDVQSRPPGPRSRARQAMCKADVALFTATPPRAPAREASACPKAGAFGPCVSKSERSTSRTASISP